MQRFRKIAWIAFSVFVASIAQAQDTSSAAKSNAASDSTQAATPTAEELAKWNCPPSEENVLPGDFFYCLATSAYGQGRYDRARQFYQTAASWASKPAQYVLGVMAWNGDQQPPNHALGLAWLALAAERHRNDFVTAYDTRYTSATAEEKQSAATLFADMQPTYADATAAVRAERRYKFGMDALKLNGAMGGQQCVAGATRGPDTGASPDAPGNSSVVCLTSAQMTQLVDKAAVNVFDGWQGHVNVGDVQTIGPAATAPAKHN